LRDKPQDAASTLQKPSIKNYTPELLASSAVVVALVEDVF